MPAKPITAQVNKPPCFYIDPFPEDSVGANPPAAIDQKGLYPILLLSLNSSLRLGFIFCIIILTMDNSAGLHPLTLPPPVWVVESSNF